MSLDARVQPAYMRAKVYFQVRFIVIFSYFYTKIRFVALATKIIKNNGVVFFKTIYVVY